ncbi:MAG: M20/M25/M40 family metallo-hydrolase [Bacteroidales bacterium]|nr:M20/M25/M40 family metallo-hydrolase [Bacteroidales bacterium]
MKVAIIYNKDLSGVINTFGMQNKEFYNEATVKKVAANLEKAGHNVAIMDGNMFIIDRLKNFMPRVIEGEQMGMVFNMAYGIQGESRYTHIPSMLEMLGIPYVGSNPSGHALALDKVMTKIIWQNLGIPTPDFWVFNTAKDNMSKVKFPVIVKPKMESVSFGLKVVYNESDLREAVHFIVTEFQQQALVEQFIPGREFCVGILGNSPVETFPVLEIDLEGDPDAIQTADDKAHKPRRKICPADISEELTEKMKQYSIDAFRALNLRDFARVDIRLDADGNIHLLEVNSMASLGETGSYPTAARVAGYDFHKLVNRMLDVAAIRYFSGSHILNQEYGDTKIQPIQSRLRTFLKSRQTQSENFLEKITNINTYVRNVDGVNQCTKVIQTELSHLGFAHEVFPQLEVGNLMYFTNAYEKELEYLILLSVDTPLKLSHQENYSSLDDVIHGTGIWENKGGIAVCLSALQTMRFSKNLKKHNIGVFIITDSAIGGKLSKDILNQLALRTKNVISLHGGNHFGSVVTSRSGAASYNFALKLIDSEDAVNVNKASQYFNKVLLSFSDSGNKDPETVVAPYDVSFHSNIFKVFAYGSAKISLRYNSMEDFMRTDSYFRKIATLSKTQKKMFQVHFEGGINRPPFEQNEQTDELFKKAQRLAKMIDTRVIEEHRWSSSDISTIKHSVPKIDGLGPVGGYDKSNSEYIIRHSMIDRALLLALLISE